MSVLGLFLLAHAASSCTVVLPARAGDTNLWQVIAELDSGESPFVLCIEGSSPQRRFTLEDSWFGCWWWSANLIITYLSLSSYCIQEPCVKETIWFMQSFTCNVQSNLAFVNVILSGQHYFRADCEQDWCTHCLSPELLVMESDGTYRTVIDGHAVLFKDAEYEEHQAKCKVDSYENAFMVFQGVQLSFERSSVLDMRCRLRRFVHVLALGVLIIRNTNVERMDTSEAFIQGEEQSFVILGDCVITGLNRDHAFDPMRTSDTGLLIGSGTVVMRRVLLQDNLVLEPLSSKSGPNLITAGNMIVEDSQFRRCTGTIEVRDLSLTDVILQGHFSRKRILRTERNLAITRCQFISNHSILVFDVYSQLIDSSLFLNNRAIGFMNDYIFVLNSGRLSVTNCSFQANGALDFSFEDYWSEYYIRQGLLNDNGLSAEMQTWARNSECKSLIAIPLSSLTLLDSTVSDQDSSSPCLYALKLRYMFPIAGSLGLIRNTHISSRGEYGISVESTDAGTLTIQHSVFEGAGILLAIKGRGGSISLLNATNVTFQKTTGSVKHSAAVSLTSMSGRFLGCQWLDNQGQDAGGIVVREGSLWLRECKFRNNSCWANAGDVYMISDNKEVEVDIAGCSYEHSQSFLSTASLLLSGKVSGRVENCTLTGAQSESGTVLRLAHTEGNITLSALLLADLDLPGAMLVQVSAATTTRTVLEGLQVLRCSFLRGFALDSGQGSPTVFSRFNLFASNNGVAISLAAGFFSDVGSVFEGNTALTELYFQGSNTSATFLNSIFRQNRPSDTVGMLYVEGPKTSVQFISCFFSENNWPRSNGVVHLQPEASSSFLNCEFRWHTNAVIVSQSLVVMTGCLFEDNTDLLRMEVGEALVSESSFVRVRPSIAAIAMINSNLTLLRCNLSEVTHGPVLSGLSSQIILASVRMETLQYEGDLVSLVDSSLQVSQSSLYVVSSGASLMALSLGSLTFLQVNISEVHAALGLFTLTESAIYFTQVEVTNSTSQVMRASLAPFISFESCTFAEISTQQAVGVLNCLACTNLIINNCLFASISAQSVGGISVQNTYTVINNSNFTLLKGRDSGAVRLSTTTVLLTHSHFHNNTAEWAGGGLHLTAQSAQLQYCSFHFNTAQSGGGLCWTLAAPVLLDVHFYHNVADYGPDRASYMAQLQVVNNSLVLASGQVFAGVLVVYIQDHIGQVVKTDSQTRASLGGVGLSGKLEATARVGELEFSGFSAVATPGTTRNLSVSTALLSLQLPFKFRLCLRGEKLENSTCVPCPVGSYSLVFNTTQCLYCPNTAECPGDGQLYPKPGYWRPSEDSDLVQQCGRAQACLGHEGFESKTGKCAQLYTGKRCQTCEEGARRNGRDRCSSCPTSGAIAWQACLVGAGLLLLWLGQVSAPEGVQVWLRTLQHYLQLTALVADFNLDWPGELQQFFALHRYQGNALQYFLPVQCIATPSVLTNALALMLSPFAVAAGLAVLSFVPGVQGKLRNAILVSCVYLHPFLLREAMSLWYCVDEGTSSWLRSDLEVRCWSSSHRLAALAVGLPGLLLWGLGIPAAALVVLVRERKQPSPGSLRTGYRDQCFYWGLLLLLWTAVLAVLNVFSASWRTFNQALTVVLVLSVAAALHTQVDPYRALHFNKWELRSLLAVLSTAYSGLYFCVIGESNALLALLFGVHLWAMASNMFLFCITRLYRRFRKSRTPKVTSLV